MIDKVKKFIKEYRREICLGSIMIVGFGLLNKKINENHVQNLSNHIENLNNTEKTLSLISNTQDHVITLMEGSK